MAHLGPHFSGIVLNQNSSDALVYAWRSNQSGNWIYQTFQLPGNYQRGTHSDELLIPDLSGFSVLVTVDSSYDPAASLKYVCQVLSAGVWTTLASGTTIGAQTAGKTWFDVYFDEPVPIYSYMLNSQFRFGITLPKGSASGEEIGEMVPHRNGNYIVNNQGFRVNLVEGFPYPITVGGAAGFLLKTNGVTTFSWQEGISSVWYVENTQMGEAFQNDGTTPLIASMATCLNYRILGLTADHGVDFLGNEYRSVVVRHKADQTDTTSFITKPGLSNSFWQAPPQPSRFAVVSHYTDLASNSTPVVVDGVLIDPITPNVAFNVYYSNDDAYTSDVMTESDWEQKLWTRIPETYHATNRRKFMFPNPVAAKYLKVEFTHLQAHSYNPGPSATPVQYKKFPSWVTTYFLAQFQRPSYVADLVDVQYDALDFLYNYYLDDLTSAPDAPQVPPTDLSSQLPTQTTSLDLTTLRQISLDSTPYQSSPNTGAGVLSQAAQISSDIVPQVVESMLIPPTDISSVSSPNREAVLFEQLMPVMYFYIPCRHSYKESSTTFDRNRAYFVGVNELNFLRSDYIVAADDPLYIEAGVDMLNSEYNSFNVTNTISDPGTWSSSNQPVPPPIAPGSPPPPPIDPIIFSTQGIDGAFYTFEVPPSGAGKQFFAAYTDIDGFVPVWSNDQALVAGSAPSGPDLITMDATGGARTVITNVPPAPTFSQSAIGGFSWYADDTKVLAGFDDGTHAGFASIRVDNSGYTAVNLGPSNATATGGGGFVATVPNTIRSCLISPDDSTVAYAHGLAEITDPSGINVCNIDGTNIRTVLQDTTGNIGYNLEDWFDDNNHLLVIEETFHYSGSTYNYSSLRLLKVALSGSISVLLDDGASGTNLDGSVNVAALSPDNTYVALLALNAFGPGQSAIGLLPSSGGTQADINYVYPDSNLSGFLDW